MVLKLRYLELKFLFVLSVVFGLLHGCGSTGDGPGRHINVDSIANAVPKKEPKSKYGNPESYVVLGKRYFVLPTSKGYQEKGIASWYGKKFHGKRTSSGETYDMYAMTAAHKSLPLPTYVRVTHLGNGRSVVLKVNDRGPFHAGRIIDLSYTAAKKLGVLTTGTAQVKVEALEVGGSESKQVQGKQDLDWRDQAHLKNRMFIQVAALSTSQSAERLMDTLLSRFANVQVVQAINESNGSKIHRVRIGPLHTIAATEGAEKKLKSMGFDDYRIVVD